MTRYRVPGHYLLEVTLHQRRDELVMLMIQHATLDTWKVLTQLQLELPAQVYRPRTSP